MGKYEARFRFWMIIMTILAVADQLDGPINHWGLAWWGSLAAAIVNGALSIYHDEP